MPIAESILPEFDHETATTRTLLERVPADKAEWKPHVKSMSLGQLAMHLDAVVPRSKAERLLVEARNHAHDVELGARHRPCVTDLVERDRRRHMDVVRRRPAPDEVSGEGHREARRVRRGEQLLGGGPAAGGLGS